MSYNWTDIYRKFPGLCKELHSFSEDYSIWLLDRIKGIAEATSLFDDMLSPQKEKINDILAEIRFIFLFLDCGWAVEKIPKIKGSKYPDLRVTSDSFSALVEIKHIRFKYSGPPSTSNTQDEMLVEYGNPRWTNRKIIDVASDAIDQIFSYLKHDPMDIPIIPMIALWSSDESIEAVDVKSSMPQLIEDLKKKKPDFPNGILIFGSLLLTRNMMYHPYQITTREPFDDVINEIMLKISGKKVYKEVEFI